jgi:hypothetical protein
MPSGLENSKCPFNILPGRLLNFGKVFCSNILRMLDGRDPGGPRQIDVIAKVIASCVLMSIDLLVNGILQSGK